MVLSHIENMKDKIIDGHAIGLISARDRLRITIEFLQKIDEVTSNISDVDLGSIIKAVAKDKKFHYEFIGTVDEIEAVTVLHKGVQIFIERMMKDFRDLSDYEKKVMGIITEQTYFKRQGNNAVIDVEEKKPLLLEEDQVIES